MELSKGYKEPETGIFPIDWEFKAVDELGTVVTGGTPSTSVKEYWGGSIPWVTPTDISRSRDMYSSDRMLSESGLRVIRALPANSVLVTCIASIGKNAILKTAGGCNQQINAVIPNDSDSDFLYYLFEKNKPILLASAGTTATSIISKKVFEKLVFSIPKIIEQRKISATLSDVDALIAGLEKLIAKKRDLKQAAMQQLLTGQTRLPGFSGEWVVKRLGDVGECLRGVSYKGDSDLFSHDTDLSKRLLRSNNVQESLVVTSDLQYVKVDRVREHQILNEGDVLICMANGSKALVGKSAYFEINDGFEYTFGAFMGAYRGNGQANRRFVFYLFQTGRYRDYITNLLAGSSINNLSPSSIESLEFKFPELSEQEAIAQTLTDMDSELIALESRLTKTRELKQGMMQELLTGRIRLV